MPSASCITQTANCMTQLAGGEAAIKMWLTLQAWLKER
jgi:hypothetical protein